MLNPEAQCLCNSGRIARECCLLPEPAITQPTSTSLSSRLNAELIMETPFGQSRLPVQTGGVNVSMRVRKVEQLDNEIESIVWAATDGMNLIVKYRAGTEPRDTLMTLSDILHAVRYHERNFYYRYTKLQTENAVNPRIVKVRGPVAVELDDMILRFEFEGFLLRIASTLDVLAKLTGIALEKHFRRESDLNDYLSSSPNRKRPHQARLKEIYDEVKWIKPLKSMRNDITHGGFWSAYKPMRYESGVVSPPKVDAVHAPVLVGQMWRDLLNLVHAFLKELYPPIPG